ncbi:hypothetical protein SK128_019776, partial [Halocaridina rubra]
TRWPSRFRRVVLREESADGFASSGHYFPSLSIAGVFFVQGRLLLRLFLLHGAFHAIRQCSCHTESSGPEELEDI